MKALVNADPAGSWTKLESAKFLNKVWEVRIQTAVAAVLADTDPEEAASIAESIADPAQRARALIEVVDALPATERARKIALLDRVALHARSAPDAVQRLWWIGEAAERLHELGEVEKARPLFAEGLRLANQMTNKKEYRRAYFAAQLALVDPAAALAIAKEFKGARVGGSFRVVLGLRMMDQDPAEALWFWKEMHGVRKCRHQGGLREAANGRSGAGAAVLRSISANEIEGAPLRVLRIPGPGPEGDMTRPPRAGPWTRSCSPSTGSCRSGPNSSRTGSRKPAARHRADRPGSRARGLLAIRGLTALRPPIRARSATIPRADLIQHLAWYDREVAAALFEPSRDRIEHTEDRELATWSSEFEAWSSFDPRAAVARLEKLPVAADPSPNDARIRVANLLGLSHEQRLRKTWPDWAILSGESRRGSGLTSRILIAERGDAETVNWMDISSFSSGLRLPPLYEGEE